MNSSDACNTYCSESLFSSNFSSNIQCGPVASFLAPYYSSGTINPGDLAKFYQTLRPDYGQNVSGILSLSWFACAITCNGNKTDEYFSSLKNICREDLCRTMQWDGDPDIAGKGMLAAYIFQHLAFLVYSVSFLLSRLPLRIFQKLRLSASFQRIQRALETSVVDFHDASTVFHIAVFVAYNLLKRDRNQSAYSTRLSAYIVTITSSIYSGTLPPAIAFGRHGSSRGLFAIFLTGAQFVVVVFLQPLKNLALDEKYNTWESQCYDVIYNPYGNKDEIYILVVYFHSVFTLAMTLLLIHWDARRSSILRGGKLFMEYIAFYFVVWHFVFASLSLTLVFSDRFRFRRIAGGRGKEEEFGFGQVLALTTWWPSVVQFVCAALISPIAAQSIKLVRKYNIIEVEEEREDEHNVVAETDIERGPVEPTVLSALHNWSERPVHMLRRVKTH